MNAIGDGPFRKGEPVWVMEADGKNPRLITRGIDDGGADHPRWL